MWILESTDPERELLFRLLPGSLKTMGRAAGVDFVVDAALVSRVHCRLTSDQSDQLKVEDLGSTNGTFVNDERIERAPLGDGDRLKVGRVEFLIKRPAPEASTEPS